MEKRWTAALLAMVLALLCAGAAGAANAFDASQPVSLAVMADFDGTPISGLRFTLFKVADMSVTDGAVGFTMLEGFAEYGDQIEPNLDPGKMDSSAWAEGAANLAPHALSDSRNGTHSFEMISAVTDSEGKASFNGMAQGLYLMTTNYEGTAYTSVSVTPVYLTLPHSDDNGESWVYAATVKAKVTGVTAPETPEETPGTMSVTARKAWSGDDTPGTSGRRPASVTVDLIDETGESHGSAELNAANGWTYTWSGLAVRSWSVVENQVPASYSPSYSSETTADGTIVTVTNTTPPAGVQGESRERTDDTKKSDGKVKGSSRQGDTGAVASANRLPQTGQLWWPVWILAGAAAVLLITGMILRMSGKRDLKDR